MGIRRTNDCQVAAKAVLQSQFSVKCLTSFIGEFKCNSNSLDNLKVATNYIFQPPASHNKIFL